ncbi:hypothetical protein AVEN_265403-1 [Araneus ventricosus]|uniref:Uncharacterized protein n=1 Tax=Araneus ventricosus TaxID=182803 RepID=A0A4Y2HQC6_ARAVE|nr:hypothetical protein AVEN_265403-1 [Araneus ventricosus]
MTRITPELACPSSDFRTTLAGGRLAPYVRFSEKRAHTHGGSSMESGFGPGSKTLPLGDSDPAVIRVKETAVDSSDIYRHPNL